MTTPRVQRIDLKKVQQSRSIQWMNSLSFKRSKAGARQSSLKLSALMPIFRIEAPDPGVYSRSALYTGCDVHRKKK